MSKREDKHPASETTAAGLTEGMYVDFCIKKKNMCLKDKKHLETICLGFIFVSY